MKIRIASDLHLEFQDLRFINNDKTDVLILAGDILVGECLHDHPPIPTQAALSSAVKPGPHQLDASRYRAFIAHIASEFPNVIVIAGNHEFYGGNWVRGITTLRKEYGVYKNIHFLENDTIKLDDITFIGATLWTNLNQQDPLTIISIKDIMNDYRQIRNDNNNYSRLHPSDTVARHSQTLSYLKSVIDQHKNEKIVVVTHHAPSMNSISAGFSDSYVMNGAFASDLSEFILDRPQIKTWIHGHTHRQQDYNIGDTRVVCNPRGYPGEYGLQFNTNFSIDLY